ncbi:hypothetical protein ACHAPV_000295 [Trichoderma viride]
MSRFALFASLMAASVAAQAEFTAPGFKYIGCAEAEPPVFNFQADVPAPFSAQQCQYACHAKGKYAAMDGNCNCYDSSSKAEPAYKIIDESVCSVPCIGGNRTAGVCGGPQCPVTGKKRYSLYKEMDHHDDDEEKTKSKDIGVWTKPLPFHNAQEKAAISPRHQPSPLNHRVLRNVALHALLKAARFVPLADASLLVLQAVPSGLLPPTLLLRHQFQRAMESTASWVLLQQHWPVLLEDAFTLIPQ